MALYLYKLTSGSYDYGRYDCYDSCVVAAESEETARLIYPDAKKDGSWASDEQAIEQWTTPENVEIELIGTAAFGIQKGVIAHRSMPDRRENSVQKPLAFRSF